MDLHQLQQYVQQLSLQDKQQLLDWLQAAIELEIAARKERYQFLQGAKLGSSSGWGKSPIVKNRSGAVKVAVNVLRKISYMGLIGIVIKESTANSKAAISVKYLRSILQMLKIYQLCPINLNRS